MHPLLRLQLPRCFGLANSWSGAERHKGVRRYFGFLSAVQSIICGAQIEDLDIAVLFAQLRAFVEVARLGNVGRAADLLCISQPALSARIKSLESHVGTRLFKRAGGGMALTPAGWGLLPHAREALTAAQIGVERAKDLNHDLDEDLVVGATRLVSTYVLPEILVEFLMNRPKVRVAIRTADSESLLGMLRQGELDVALVLDIPTHGFDAQPIFMDPLYFVARPGMVPTASGRIDRKELARLPIIFFDRHSNYHEIMQGLFSAAGVSPSRQLEVNDFETAKRLAELGLGLSLLPATVAASALASRSLSKIDVVGINVEPRRIIAARTRAEPNSRAVREFIAILRRTPELIAGPTRVPLDLQDQDAGLLTQQKS